MLKIKDNVDLKELEKYLTYKTFTNLCDEKISAWCCIDKYNDIQFYFDKNGKISYTTYPECRSEEIIYCKLYDLIKANLVEKVED